jgi:hypothetical protein
MDLSIIVADAGYVVQIAQLAIQAGEDIVPFVEMAYQILVNKTALTDAQRAELVAQETALRAQLNASNIPADQS